TEGPLLAFLRRDNGSSVLVAVPLIRYETPFPSAVAITLPQDAPRYWTDAFTGETLGPELSWPKGRTTWPVILATSR
ncbi:MAG TPA: hypothetical protein VKQ52_12800, partial [Puia sp.]|nr:hypothetical protein [Puia sp.]